MFSLWRDDSNSNEGKHGRHDVNRALLRGAALRAAHMHGDARRAQRSRKRAAYKLDVYALSARTNAPARTSYRTRRLTRIVTRIRAARSNTRPRGIAYRARAALGCAAAS